jgi:hypothetical protein
VAIATPRLLILCAFALRPGLSEAQFRAEGMARAVPTLTAADPRPGGGTLTEARVLPAVRMVALASEAPWRIRCTLDL